MKIYAVVAEFNPFHNGHAHLIRKIKERERDCAVVAVMSGSFTQRGDIAIIDKYARAASSLMCGADLVLELPAPWCFSGAEFFALGGISVANGLGVVDSLAFGSESGDIDSLIKCEANLSSEEYRAALDGAKQVSKNTNIAKLRADVYRSLYGECAHFNGSNDLLGLEYLHALRTLDSSIIPITIKREGESYNSEKLTGICSATAIRRAVYEGDTLNLGAYMPRAAADILESELNAKRYFELSRLDTAIIARLRTCVPSELSGIMEISDGMEHRICKAAMSYTTIDGLADAVCNRKYSASRVRRALLSAMLNVKMSDAEAVPQFTAVLGANEAGREVLSLARKKASIKIISKQSQAKYLDGEAAEQFALHMRAERLGELCCVGEPRRVGAVML